MEYESENKNFNLYRFLMLNDHSNPYIERTTVLFDKLHSQEEASVIIHSC